MSPQRKEIPAAAPAQAASTFTTMAADEATFISSNSIRNSTAAAAAALEKMPVCVKRTSWDLHVARKFW
jgi:hypothetical protein